VVLRLGRITKRMKGGSDQEVHGGNYTERGQRGANDKCETPSLRGASMPNNRPIPSPQMTSH
jgi:hypothetical protein